MSNDTKHCPRCNQDLPLDAYGYSHARADRKNIYCKQCNRDHTNDSRRRQRERKAQPRRMPPPGQRFPPPEIQAPAPANDVDLVRDELRKLGTATQDELLDATKLTKDALGEALAELVLWTKEVKTRLDDETRTYFLTKPAARAA